LVAALANATSIGTDYCFRQSNVNSTKVEFQKKSKLSQKEIDRIESRTLDFLERYIEISKIVGRGVVFKNPLKNFKIGSYSDVEAAVEKLRDVLNLGESQLSNLMEMLKGKGICIFEIKTQKGFDGLSGFVGDIPVVILNASLILDGKRVTLAQNWGTSY